MKQFEEIDSLSRTLKSLCERFETEDELFDELIAKEAVFHKSCINLYDKQKLCRKRKALLENSKENEELEGNNSEVNPERRAKRRSLIQSDKPSKSKTCFLCSRVEDNEENLH